MSNKILYIQDVENMVGRHRQTLWRWCSKDKFPKPTNINGRNAWYSSTIQNWINKQMGNITEEIDVPKPIKETKPNNIKQEKVNMNFEINTLDQTMSSLEIAKLTSKQHKHVLADIRKMLLELEIDAAEFSATQSYGNNNEREVFNLPRRECDILISGYEIKYRAAIVDRWHELEANKPKLTLAESNLQYAQSVVDLERAQKISDEKHQELENAQKELENDNKLIKNKVSGKFIEQDTRLNEVELITQRKGVPFGYINERVARKNDGRLSMDIFKETMKKFSVPQLTYSTISPEGYPNYPTAYKADAITPAIQTVIDSATPISPKAKVYYTSVYINGSFKINFK